MGYILSGKLTELEKVQIEKIKEEILTLRAERERHEKQLKMHKEQRTTRILNNIGNVLIFGVFLMYAGAHLFAKTTVTF